MPNPATSEQLEDLQKLEPLCALANHNGYKIIVEMLESKVSDCQAKMRSCRVSDPVLKASLMDEWRKWEDLLRWLKETLDSAHSDRLRILSDINSEPEEFNVRENW